MKKLIATLLLVPFIGMQFAGCAEMSQTQKGAAAGAVAGGLLGAAVGNRKGALAGAALGAVAGAIIANYYDKQTASRAEAAKKYGPAKTDRLEIENASLTPENVSPGSTVESAVQYTTLAAAESQQIKVTETRTLISGTDSVQLANREVVRSQGTHVSNMKFTLPKDVAKGSYTLVTTVSDGKNTKTVKNPMQVV